MRIVLGGGGYEDLTWERVDAKEVHILEGLEQAAIWNFNERS